MHASFNVCEFGLKMLIHSALMGAFGIADLLLVPNVMSVGSGFRSPTSPIWLS